MQARGPATLEFEQHVEPALERPDRFYLAIEQNNSRFTLCNLPERTIGAKR